MLPGIVRFRSARRERETTAGHSRLEFTIRRRRNQSAIGARPHSGSEPGPGSRYDPTSLLEPVRWGVTLLPRTRSRPAHPDQSPWNPSRRCMEGHHEAVATIARFLSTDCQRQHTLFCQQRIKGRCRPRARLRHGESSQGLTRSMIPGSMSTATTSAERYRKDNVDKCREHDVICLLLRGR